MPDVLLEINERRYAAEREYSRVKNSRLAEYARAGDSVTVARARAEVDAMDALKVWHDAKAEYHFAEDSMRALQTKIYSFLNLNKGLVTQFQSYR